MLITSRMNSGYLLSLNRPCLSFHSAKAAQVEGLAVTSIRTLKLSGFQIPAKLSDENSRQVPSALQAATAQHLLAQSILWLHQLCNCADEHFPEKNQPPTTWFCWFFLNRFTQMLLAVFPGTEALSSTFTVIQAHTDCK